MMDNKQEENFYEALGIPEDATDEQMDIAYAAYVSKHHLNNPDDGINYNKGVVLNSIKEKLKSPQGRYAYNAMLRAAKYDADTDFRLLCGEKDLQIEALKNLADMLEKTIELKNGNEEGLEAIIKLLKNDNATKEQLIASQQKIIDILQESVDMQEDTIESLKQIISAQKATIEGDD